MKQKFKWIIGSLLMLCAGLTYAQEKAVSGTVTDQNGLPLPGVSVIIVSTTSGTQTDFDGNYTINVEEGQTLRFSYIGQATVERIVGSEATLNVQMEEDAQALEEVVVTAQGIKSKPRSLSYAVQSVDSDDIDKSRETNVVSALSAKAAGVQVTTSSGSVGASANIRVRGNTSITRSNAPLFVVDGVPIDNSSFSEDPTQTSNNSSLGGSDFSNRAIDINSSDIESVNILKGIAAQTLYGLRAANGVVLITTKKGKSGKTKVTLSTSTILSDYNKGPALQKVYAQGRHSELGQLEYRGPETFEGDSWGPKIADLEFDGDGSYPFDRGGRLVPAGTGNGIPARAYNNYDFFRTGDSQDINLSVSGGNDKFNYRASAGRLHQDGISPNERFERKTFRLDFQAKLNEKLTLDASGQYANSGGFRVQRGSNISGIMLGLLRTAPTFDNGNGLTGQAAADNPATYYYDIPGSELPGQRSYRDGIYNSPYFAVARNRNTDDVNRLIGKMGLTYDFNDWLSFRSSASIDRYTDIRKIGFDLIDASFGGGRVINDVISNQDVNWNFLVSINHEFNERLDFTANIGYDGFYNKNNRQTVLGDGMAIPGFFNLSNVATTQAQELTGAKKLIGAFATATLGYDNMLFLTPAFRNDWSSTLPVGANTFQSYSIGGSFVFSELFNEDAFVNYGKLRGSWGRTGNDAPVYATVTNFGGTSVGGDGFVQSTTFPAYDATSFERSERAGNPNLTPEKTTEFEVGIEVAMLNSRLKFDFAYYDKETTDQIIPVDTAPSSGFIDRFLNAGIVSNTGYEVSLGGSPIRTDNFSWDISANWTTYENVVEELVDGVESITLNGFSGTSSRAIAGESYGSFFGSRFKRNDEGQVLIDDAGYPLQADEDGIVGDPIPDWLAGISNSFRYKNFGLSVLFDIRQGGDVWCGTCGILDYFGVSEATLVRDQTTVFEGVVQSTGAINTQVVPYSNTAVSENNNYWRRYGFGGLSETAVYDASWVRLREITLSYDLPSKFLDGTFIEGISISGFGRNLWLNTEYPGVDPETNLTGDSNGIGLDYFNQPNTRSYGLNVKLNF